jgi:Flp pilus assembly CpaF family ATPase
MNDENFVNGAFSRDELFADTVMRLLAPVEDLLAPAETNPVSEIMINGPDEIYIERAGRIEAQPDRRFADAEAPARPVSRTYRPSAGIAERAEHRDTSVSESEPLGRRPRRERCHHARCR